MWMHSLADNFALFQLELGPMANFVYLLGDPMSKDMVVIDPAWDVNAIWGQAHALEFRIGGILLTHGHPDHTNGISGLLSHADVPVYISRHEAPYYRPQNIHLTDLDEGATVSVGNLDISVIATPGHTPGGLCYHIDNHLITGDTLFIDACGRVDLPGGSAAILYDSLQRLKQLPDKTRIYPGHHYGKKTWDTLANQKKSNPYLAVSRDEFLSIR
jgi:glyoxylase-like metal-dependent hydrolase (beta-lactamase superfamily II)